MRRYELVLDEVVAGDPNHVSMGNLFRTSPVSVIDAAQRPICHGVEPEAGIIELMDRALSILNNDELPVLVRVSVFHFMFAYAHPFYDGNGCTNWFISIMYSRIASARLSGIACRIP